MSSTRRSSALNDRSRNAPAVISLACPKILPEDRIHLPSDGRVENYQLRFVVERYRPVVEVHRSQSRKQALGAKYELIM
jgi:hypothetical protein